MAQNVTAPPQNTSQANTELLQAILNELKVLNTNLSSTTSAIPKMAHLKPVLPSELLEVKQAKADKDNNSAYNFLIASARLTGSLGDLPSEVVEYGQRTGRLPRLHDSNSKPLADASTPLSAPNFADLEL